MKLKTVNQPEPAAFMKPTPAELAILNVLWNQGPSTVRTVHEVISASNGSGYTTVLKLLQIMHQKGLVCRDDSSRAHVYQPISSRSEVRHQMTSDLVQRVFDGSPAKLVELALAQVRASSADELLKLRAVLNEFEEDT